MKRAVLVLATVALLAMLVFAPVALAQGTTATGAATTMAPATTAMPATAPKKAKKKLAPSGGPAILLPAAALLLGSGVLTYAILRRR